MVKIDKIITFLLACILLLTMQPFIRADSNPPVVTINFAGNPGEKGGPYRLPPNEWPNATYAGSGYYTNASKQSENWIYVNCTVVDTDGVSSVYLQVKRNTTWTNDTYAFTHRGTGNYWDINTSGTVTIQPNSRFTFNVKATDGSSNSGITHWCKVGKGATVDRYVYLNWKTKTNISYIPLYTKYWDKFDTGSTQKDDVLYHDQATDGGPVDTGELSNETPGSYINERACAAFVVYWFGANVSINPFTLKNIYAHIWWKSNNNSMAFSWYRNRGGISSTLGQAYDKNWNSMYDAKSVTTTSAFSDPYYWLADGTKFYMSTYHKKVNIHNGTENFTENSIYEFAFSMESGANSPIIICNRSMESFVLFNVPDNNTLNTTGVGGKPLDSDGDGLSDWTELYKTYTNPFVADTDNDGKNDSYENSHGTDPNDYKNYTLKPIVQINFAGNRGELGGPYTIATTDGTSDYEYASEGYYTNDSYQSEKWIYINASVGITGNDSISNVWLQWMNKTGSVVTWTNNTYQFIHRNGIYWDINTSGMIATKQGSKYSFNVRVVSAKGAENNTCWNKTGEYGTVRRYVYLNCRTRQSAAYKPFYFITASNITSSNDRLHHDQASMTHAAGYLTSALPAAGYNNARYALRAVNYWFDDNNAYSNFTLSNLYFHFWWATNDTGPAPKKLDNAGWWKTRATPGSSTVYNGYPVISTLSKSNFTGTPYGSNNKSYHLEAGHRTTGISQALGENNISEFSIEIGAGGITDRPTVLSNRSRLSFVLFNVPDNNTLNTTDWTSRGGAVGDYDGDGLSDWTELYKTYTSPFITDTDNDGQSDYMEYLDHSDPNNISSRSPDDTTPPNITINFAGNHGNLGGPYYQPPGETTHLTGTNAEGYYTNDSYQQASWIYINATIIDDSGITSAKLHWQNMTTNRWFNTSSFIHQGTNNYYEINTSTILTNITANNKYSFRIYATDGEGNVKSIWWNKTGIGGRTVKRAVSLSCPVVDNISYVPLYLYNNTIYTLSDLNTKDRLHHDQGPNGTTHDTGGLLKNTPGARVEKNWCGNFIAYWFDDNVTMPKTEIKNYYAHTWYSSTNFSIGWTHRLRFGKTRDSESYATGLQSYNIQTNDRNSNTTYNDTINYTSNHYYLLSRLLKLKPHFNVTSNNVYELMFEYEANSGYPAMFDNRSFLSYIIFNVPDNNTLNTTDWFESRSHDGKLGDYDGDGLSDWTELYKTHTSPFVADTDGDGQSDYTEYYGGSDPNNASSKANPMIYDNSGHSWPATGTNLVTAFSSLTSNAELWLPKVRFEVASNLCIGHNGIKIHGNGTIINLTNSRIISSANPTSGTDSVRFARGLDDIELDNITFSGDSQLEMTLGNNTILRNMTAENTYCQRPAAFRFVLPTNVPLVSDLTVVDCHTYRVWWHSFQINSPVENETCHIKNILFNRCTSEYAGYEYEGRGTRNDGNGNWSVGFSPTDDYSSNLTVENLLMKNCTSEYSWQSGFHMENSPTKINITIENCKSNNNGQIRYYYNVSGKTYYCSGFLVDSGSVTLKNCKANNNTRYGFWGSAFPIFINCSGTGNWEGTFNGNYVNGSHPENRTTNGVSAFEWQSVQGIRPYQVRINNTEYYLIGARGNYDSDGYLYTIKVWNSNGSIRQSVIDTYHFAAGPGLDANTFSIVHIPNTDKYAVYWENEVSVKARVNTIRVSENGMITKSIIGDWTSSYSMQNIGVTGIIQVSGHVYALVHELTNSSGYLETIWINTSGTINSTVLATKCIAAYARYPSITSIDNDTIAVCYNGATETNSGEVSTYNITNNGRTILPADHWALNLAKYGSTYFNSLTRINGSIFAYTWRNGTAGYVLTTTVANNGHLGKDRIDQLRFDTNCRYPCFFVVTQGYYGVSYQQGDNLSGWTKTITIAANGTIGSIVKSINWEWGQVQWFPRTIYVSNNYWLIVYPGADSSGYTLYDGWAVTINIGSEAVLQISGYTITNGHKRHAVDNLNFSATITGATEVYINIQTARGNTINESLLLNYSAANSSYWCNRNFSNGKNHAQTGYGWPAVDCGNGTYQVYIFAKGSGNSEKSDIEWFRIYPNADVSMDNHTNFVDLTAITGSNWGLTGTNRFCKQDVNGDGRVNFNDLTFITGPRSWGWSNVP